MADAVAPAQIIRRFGVPRRVVTVIEGENLTNDWTALTLYRFATTAVVSGAFNWATAAPRVSWIVLPSRSRRVTIS